MEEDLAPGKRSALSSRVMSWFADGMNDAERLAKRVRSHFLAARRLLAGRCAAVDLSECVNVRPHLAGIRGMARKRDAGAWQRKSGCRHAEVGGGPQLATLLDRADLCKA